MRVRLKGIHKVRRRRADGTTALYCYAWRGGPRLPGEPGSPEFLAAWQAATATRTRRHAGTLQALLTDYQHSPDFTDLAPRTRKDYIRHILRIEAEFGDMPLALMADRRVRGDMLAWRDRLATASPRQADYALAVLALVLAWGVDRGACPANPLERPGRLYRADRAERVWNDADEAALLRAAPDHLRLALILAADTGQRQGDLLRLPWSAWDGTSLHVRQGKTGRRVKIPATERLRAALTAAPRRAVTILTTLRGRAWTSDGFRTSWAKACAAAQIEGLTFHDLRGTAVTRLALAGCSVPEIAAITGHALKEVETILDAHYLGRSTGLATAAVAKLESHRQRTPSVKRPVKRSARAPGTDAG